MENAFKVKSEKITSILIQTHELTPEKIRELLRSELGDDFYITIKKFIKFGFNYSFKTESPFVSSGIFFNNILKIFPEFRNELSSTSPLFFKNMVMHKGSTKIRINSYSDFQKIELEFSKNYGLPAPKLEEIFEALLSDKSAIQRIIDNEICIEHIKEIFSHLLDPEWESRLNYELLKKDELIKNLEGKIESYEIKKRFEIDEKKIKEIDEAIENYQKQIIKYQTIPPKRVL